MSIIDKVKESLNYSKGEEILFSIIFIITLFFIFSKIKTRKTNNSRTFIEYSIIHRIFVSLFL